MKFRALPIAGLFAIDLDPIRDERGFFARAWCTSEFSDAGIDVDFVQANVARTISRGAVRGMHFQLTPAEETKLVRCTAGRIFDVAVDVRPKSATYGQWYGQILDCEKQNMLLIPGGCAHGYQALDDHCDVHYMVSSAYSPALERGILWNDASVGIDWPITKDVTVSTKDQALPRLNQLIPY